MGTPSYEGRLDKWTDELRSEFNILRARSHSIKGALKMICDNYPDAHEYAYATVHGYTRSPQGQKEYKEAIALVREQAKTKSFSQRGSRVDTLIETAEKLLWHFRSTEKVSELTRLASPTRSTLAEIRSEVDPYGLEDSATRSHFERLLGGFSKLEDKKQEMILEDTAKWISTSQIESN